MINLVAFIKRNVNSIIIILCLFAILPYFIAGSYIHPFFDDYFFASQIDEKGIFGFIRYFYLNWSGRYSEEILMALFNAKIVSSGNIQFVLLAVFIMSAVFFAMFYLVHILFKNYCSLTNRVIIALSGFTFYLVFMPELFTSFYWYCSSYYQLSLAFLLLDIGLIINILIKERSLIYKGGILLLNVFIAGFSEVTVFSVSILYFSIIVYHYIKLKRINTFLILLLLVFITFAMFNLLSHGNIQRMSVSASHTGGGNGFFFSSIRAVYDLILFHGIYTFFKTPFLFLCLLFVPWLIKYLKSDNPIPKIFKVNPLYSILITLFIFYLHHALTLYGAGYSLQGRVFNFSVLLFWLALIYNLFAVLTYFSGKIPSIFSEISPQATKWAFAVIVLLFSFSDNNRLLIGDLTRELPAYQKQMCHRYELIEKAKKNGAQDVIVPQVKAFPKLFLFGEDSKCKTSSFVNEKKFLGEAEMYFKIKIKTKD